MGRHAPQRSRRAGRIQAVVATSIVSLMAAARHAPLPAFSNPAFSRSGIEGRYYSGNLVGAMDAQVGAFREALTQQPVGVFVGAALPSRRRQSRRPKPLFHRADSLPKNARHHPAHAARLSLTPFCAKNQGPDSVVIDTRGLTVRTTKVDKAEKWRRCTEALGLWALWGLGGSQGDHAPLRGKPASRRSSVWVSAVIGARLQLA